MNNIKLGLALSGGGFRAALFHIGVLARLAEVDLLRQVEVLSTVSGGSIIGAFYYLKLKQLLEGGRSDYPNPTRQAYLTIVKELEQEFLRTVQKNLRVMAFSDPQKNFRVLWEDYSHSDRIGELYTEYFFAPILGTPNVHLSDLHITPASLQSGFDVDKYNATSLYKIPILTINATCLNTGHPWHFTGSWVGEPPPIQSPTRRVLGVGGMNRTLEQLRFDGFYQDDRTRPLNEKQKSKLKELTLGNAVAASAAVPGIFPPLAIHDLYESQSSPGEEIVVELVDGGVFDNQGLDTLFAGCTHVICSDASSQLEDERLLSTRFYKVLQRSSDVMMDRIRGQGFYVLDKEIANCVFFHLRQTFPGISGYPTIPGDPGRPNSHAYRLANLRTDLDSFSDLEAYSLMYDGYFLSSNALQQKGGLGIAANPLPPSQDWQFLKIRDFLTDPGKQETLLRHLKAGKRHFFRVFFLTRWAYLAAAPWALLAAWVVWALWDVEIIISLGHVILLVVLFVLSLRTGIGRLVRYLNYPRRLGRAVVLVVFGVIAARIHLNIFDRLFLRIGRIADLVSSGPKTVPAHPPQGEGK
jgi:NTE family protein